MYRFKRLIATLVIIVCIASCKNKEEKGKFTVSGMIKNIADQKIYLEQLFFSQKNPEVLDTAEIKNGKFTLSAIAPEEGLYRLRLQNVESSFIFINDQSEIKFDANVKDVRLQNPEFSGPANHLLKDFIIQISQQRDLLQINAANLDSLKKINGTDSLAIAKTTQLNQLAENFKGFILKSVDTLSDPVVAMFALGYTQGIDPALLEQPVNNLAKRFSNHQGISSLLVQYNQMMTVKKEQQQTIANGNGKPGIGSLAPDFTMKDTEGNSFSLSQLKGKYVLVDFWASWCGPCRAENPNVVAAYNKYKGKNFTVLGVSLDDDKNAWLQAIKDDNLTWKHISDLKHWNSAAVNLYGFDGIPYNVLIDPQGKIIGTELRGEELEKELNELL